MEQRFVLQVLTSFFTEWKKRKNTVGGFFGPTAGAEMAGGALLEEFHCCQSFS